MVHMLYRFREFIMPIVCTRLDADVPLVSVSQGTCHQVGPPVSTGVTYTKLGIRAKFGRGYPRPWDRPPLRDQGTDVEPDSNAPHHDYHHHLHPQLGNMHLSCAHLI